MQSVLFDAAGHRRSPVTMPGFHEGRAPRNKGQRYPADPPTAEEIIAVMRAAGNGIDGARLRALVVILWRAGLRIGEALELAETDLDVLLGASRQGWPSPRGRDGPLGMGSVGALDGRPAGAAGRRAVLCDPRRHRRSPVGVILGAQATGGRCGCASTLRASSALSRARGRDGARGGATGRYPTPARTCQPRYHLDLSAGDR
jgi:hypothetical protein